MLPPDMRGQGFGLSATGMMGGQGLTPPLAGAVAVLAGPAVAMAAAGAATVLAAVLKVRDRFAGQRIGLVITGGNVDLDALPW